MPTVGQRPYMTRGGLRWAMHRLGLTQEGLAVWLGVTQPSVHDWLDGRYPVPGPVAAAVRAWTRHGLPKKSR
jgi:DNA-binding transcriptional regulator YiaG